MINRKVIDISHWNPVSDWNAVKAAGIVGVVAKATESNSYKDDRYAINKAGAAANGLLFGAYHFLHPGDMQIQVNSFLDMVGVDNTMLYALDWELSSAGTASAAQAKQFMQILDGEIGANRTVLYSGNVAKEQIQGRDIFFGNHRLWLAQYGPNPILPASWSSYWLWQYSDGTVGPQPHGCPGVSGACDTNSWPGTDAQLIAQWSGASSPVVQPPVVPPPIVMPATVTIITTGAVQVIVNGKVLS